MPEPYEPQRAPMSPTDQLSSCIMWSCAVIVIIGGIIGLIFAAILFSGFWKSMHG